VRITTTSITIPKASPVAIIRTVESGVSPITAKTHVSRILGKLGARDRVQFVIAAYQAGVVRVTSEQDNRSQAGRSIR
jgi:hypothetical protein